MKTFLYCQKNASHRSKLKVALGRKQTYPGQLYFFTLVRYCDRASRSVEGMRKYIHNDTYPLLQRCFLKWANHGLFLFIFDFSTLQNLPFNKFMNA